MVKPLADNLEDRLNKSLQFWNTKQINRTKNVSFMLTSIDPTLSMEYLKT